MIVTCRPASSFKVSPAGVDVAGTAVGTGDCGNVAVAAAAAVGAVAGAGVDTVVGAGGIGVAAGVGAAHATASKRMASIKTGAMILWESILVSVVRIIN